LGPSGAAQFTRRNEELAELLTSVPSVFASLAQASQQATPATAFWFNGRPHASPVEALRDVLERVHALAPSDATREILVPTKLVTTHSLVDAALSLREELSGALPSAATVKELVKAALREHTGGEAPVAPVGAPVGSLVAGTPPAPTSDARASADELTMEAAAKAAGIKYSSMSSRMGRYEEENGQRIRVSSTNERGENLYRRSDLEQAGLLKPGRRRKG
jgi:hypothetical protein